MNEEAVKEETKEERPKEVKELLSWESPSRPFKKRDRKFFFQIGLVLLLAAFIALFVQEFLLIAVFLALFFFFYVSGTIEPGDLTHKITNQGITTATHSYIWDELTDFWFSERYGATILNVGTKVRFPSRLIMLVPILEKEKIKTIFLEYIPFREVAPSTWADQTIEWVSRKLPASWR